jgi:hypothetical protein
MFGHTSLIGLDSAATVSWSTEDCHRPSDVIVQFPLIAYGRMFTPDWAHVLNFHIICCCMVRPVSQYGNWYMGKEGIKGTGHGRMVYFTIRYI